MLHGLTEFIHTRRNLPHIHRNQGIYFVTFRLAGSLPKEVIELYREAKEATQLSKLSNKDILTTIKYNELLDGNSKGPKYLAQSQIAACVSDALHFLDGKEYKLICYCIMPNHVHLIFSLLKGNRGLSKLMQTIKRHTSRTSNKILGKNGKFWQDESFDRYVRDENELEKIIDYIKLNPMKAGLVKNWSDWKFTYIKEHRLLICAP